MRKQREGKRDHRRTSTASGTCSDDEPRPLLSWWRLGALTQHKSRANTTPLLSTKVTSPGCRARCRWTSLTNPPDSPPGRRAETARSLHASDDVRDARGCEERHAEANPRDRQQHDLLEPEPRVTDPGLEAPDRSQQEHRGGRGSPEEHERTGPHHYVSRCETTGCAAA